jgi:hypothetical protein
MALDRGEPVEVYNSYQAAVNDMPRWTNVLKRLNLKDPYTIKVHVHYIGKQKFYGLFAECMRKK